MGEIVVKDNVRYTKKDAQRVDVVMADAVQVKVPIKDTDAWVEQQAQEARDALRAELEAEGDRAKAELEAELAQRRAEFERELEAKRAGDAPAPDAVNADPITEGETVEVAKSDGDAEPDTAVETEAVTKVEDPAVTKARQPNATKSRGK